MANAGTLLWKTVALSVLSNNQGGVAYNGDDVFGVKLVVTWYSSLTGPTTTIDLCSGLYNTWGSDGKRVFETAAISPPDGYDSIQEMKVVFSAHMKPSSPRYSFYLASPKLETGNVATDWSPAPEDTKEEIDQAMDAQTQEDIFNKLTNNGALQGLYMQDGKLYINAEYLAAGTIASKDGKIKWNLDDGTIDLTGNFTSKSSVGTLKSEVNNGVLRIMDGSTFVVDLGASLGANGYEGVLSLFGKSSQTMLGLSELVLGGNTVLTIQNGIPQLQVGNIHLSGGLSVASGYKGTLQWKTKGTVSDSEFVLVGR